MRMLLQLCLCWHNRRHHSDFLLSFFLIKYLCWVRISSFPVKPTHWKWTLSYFLSHSPDETENRANEVAETNRLDRLKLSELSHCLPGKKINEYIKKETDLTCTWLSGWSAVTLPWVRPPVAWPKCCFWLWLSWKDMICIIEMEKLGASPLQTLMWRQFLMHCRRKKKKKKHMLICWMIFQPWASWALQSQLNTYTYLVVIHQKRLQEKTGYYTLIYKVTIKLSFQTPLISHMLQVPTVYHLRGLKSPFVFSVCVNSH